MTPTVGPTTPILTPSVGAFANYHTTPSAPEGAVTQYGDVLRHAPDIVLDARQYTTTGFAHELLRLLSILRIGGWTTITKTAQTTLKIHKVSGSLTNAVFFISHMNAPTVLLRIYGPSSSSLVSRPEELQMLQVLSSRYRIGPRVYGTFENGRVEEYFEADALTAAEMRDPEVSTWIGMRMAELHKVDPTSVGLGGPGGEEGVRGNVRRWLGPAREVVRQAEERGYAREKLAELDLERFAREWETYWEWLMDWERTHGRSPRVFAHNDTQYGNLLRLRGGTTGAPEQQLIVVDFEYAATNAAAFDIANHFEEWMADYHGAHPETLRQELYPNVREREHFYGAYIKASGGERGSEEELERAVAAWSGAAHGMWAIWGIVQALEGVVKGGEARGEEEFDYVEYACGRMREFREAQGAHAAVACT